MREAAIIKTWRRAAPAGEHRHSDGNVSDGGGKQIVAALGQPVDGDEIRNRRGQFGLHVVKIRWTLLFEACGGYWRVAEGR